MSAQLLEALDRERAFAPRGRFHELSIDYVTFDELTGDRTADDRLRRAIEVEPAINAVVGPSGVGKSALIRAVTETLTEERPGIRIPVAPIGQAAADPVAVGRHVIGEVLAQADLARHQREALHRAIAQRVTRRTGTRKGAVGLLGGIPQLVGIQIGGEISSAGLDLDTMGSPADIASGLDRIVQIFAAQELEPILIFEDTDAWLQDPSGPIDDAASDFFGKSLGTLARDVDINVVIATHPRYTDLSGYRALKGRVLTEIHVPELPRPQEAIATILQKHIDVSEADGQVSDVLTDEALGRLEAEYDHSDRSLRHVLQVCDFALEQAGPIYPDALEAAHVRGAAAATR